MAVTYTYAVESGPDGFSESIERSVAVASNNYTFQPADRGTICTYPLYLAVLRSTIALVSSWQVHDRGSSNSVLTLAGSGFSCYSGLTSTKAYSSLAANILRLYSSLLGSAYSKRCQ